MFSRVRIAIRFFFLGLAVGVLLAPRSGEETRRMLRDRADRLLNDILDAASLGTSSSAGAPPAEEAAAPRPARGANGSGSSRSRRSSSSSTATDAEAEAEATSAGA
jgi:hypothetical protein